MGLNKMDINEDMDNGAHLPYFLKDFHDQKNVFKYIHTLGGDDPRDDIKDKVSWIDAQCYVIDYFLWSMAAHGFTLQKWRKKDVKFLNLDDDIKKMKDRELEILKQLFKK